MTGFTDAERERIREGLLAAGRDLFARHGLDKTTIADLTAEVGIADSTFYRFFDSKDDLYIEVLDREGGAILERVLADSFEAHDDPEAAILAFLRELMDEIETNPLVRDLLVDDEQRRRLQRRFSEADQRRQRRESLSYFLPYVREQYEAGALRGPDPETVAGAIQAVTFLVLHREEIGENYPAVRDLVVEALAAGLTDTG